ncbi:Survival motor neuron protein [Anthophora plagiata]
MADDNVLFVRENGNVANADNEDAWDDSALIKAYDKAVNLAKEEVVKRIGMEVQNLQPQQTAQNFKQPQHTNKKWIVGAPCRAVYTEDGKIYEAVITKIYENSDTCLVRFIGYRNKQKVELSCLLESEGFQKQVDQRRNALAKKHSEENETDETKFSQNINSHRYNRDKMDCESEETKTYKQHFMPGPSFNSAADVMPPAPPLPPQLMAKLPDSDADALSSMLMSWYISGFHTGYYYGLKQASNNQEKRKNC